MAESETAVSPLAAIRDAHLLCTHSSTFAIRAGCSCGVRFKWDGREEEHAAHVDAMVVQHFAVETEEWRKTADDNTSNAWEWRDRAEAAEGKLRDPWDLEGNAAAMAWKARVDAVQAWAEEEYGDASEFPTGLVFALFGSVAAELHEVKGTADANT